MAMKILLVDDHPLMRRGLRDLLEEQKDMKVVGEADNGRQALSQLRETAPDVVIMDVSMPGLNGVEATRQILAKAPQTRVVALSMHRDSIFVAEMLKAGAKGYVLKTNAPEELIQALRAVKAGQTYLSPEVTSVVADGFLGRLNANGDPSGVPLTRCQIEVLQLVAEGLTTKEIARRLGRSPKTVEMHRRHLMERVGLHGVAGLTKYAISRGLASLDG